MKQEKRLTRTEFEVMEAIWKKDKKMTANQILENLPSEKEWKIQTLITLLKRIVNKGYLETEKKGGERLYYAMISRDVYLKMETKDFLTHYHNNSFKNMVSTLIDEESDETLEEILVLLEEWKRDGKRQ